MTAARGPPLWALLRPLLCAVAVSPIAHAQKTCADVANTRTCRYYWQCRTTCEDVIAAKQRRGMSREQAEYETGQEYDRCAPCAATPPPTLVPLTLAPPSPAPPTPAPPTPVPATAAPKTNAPVPPPTLAPPTPHPPTPAPATDTPASPPTSVPAMPAPSTLEPPTPHPPTAAPQTGVPATAVPTTGAPPTQVPATGAPRTRAPATAMPATGAPPTQVPATPAPPTSAPPTSAPQTSVPMVSTTDAPQTGVPATAAPTTDAPPTQMPATGAPRTRAPATAMPATGAPPTQVPATPAPPTSAPPTSAPQTSVPMVSTTDAPPTQVPTMGVPRTAVPRTTSPATAVSTGAPPPQVPLTPAPPTSAPPTSAPATLAPQTGVPATAVPTTDTPPTQVPATGAPRTRAPATAMPATGAPPTQVPATPAPPTSAPPTSAPQTSVPMVPTTDAPQTGVPATAAPTRTPVATTSAPPVTLIPMTARPMSTPTPTPQPGTGVPVPVATVLPVVLRTPRPRSSTARPSRVVPPAAAVAAAQLQSAVIRSRGAVLEFVLEGLAFDPRFRGREVGVEVLAGGARYTDDVGARGGALVSVATDTDPGVSPYGVAGTLAAVPRGFLHAEVLAGGEVLRVTLRHAGFYARAPHAERLAVGLSGALFEGGSPCARVACAFDFTLRDEHPDSDAREAAVAAVSTAAVGLASLGVLTQSPVAARLPNLMMVSRAMLCPFSGPDKLDRTLNPLGLTFGDDKFRAYNGAVFGNLLLNSALGGVVAAIALWLRHRVRREYAARQRAARAVDGDDGARAPAAIAIPPINRTVVLSRARFGWLIVPFGFMYGGAVVGSFTAMAYSTAIFKVLAALLLVSFVMLVPYYVWKVARGAPARNTYRRDLGYTGCRRFFWGNEEWSPDTSHTTAAWCDLHHLVYDGYVYRYRGFMLVEIIVMLLLGALTAWQATDTYLCWTRACVMTGVLLLNLIALLCCRPYIAPYENIFEISIVAVELVMMFATLSTMQADRPVDHWGLRWLPGMAMTAMWLTIVKFVIDTVIFFIDEYEVWAAGRAERGFDADVWRFAKYILLFRGFLTKSAVALDAYFVDPGAAEGCGGGGKSVRGESLQSREMELMLPVPPACEAWAAHPLLDVPDGSSVGACGLDAVYEESSTSLVGRGRPTPALEMSMLSELSHARGVTPRGGAGVAARRARSMRAANTSFPVVDVAVPDAAAAAVRTSSASPRRPQRARGATRAYTATAAGTDMSLTQLAGAATLLMGHSPRHGPAHAVGADASVDSGLAASMLSPACVAAPDRAPPPASPLERSTSTRMGTRHASFRRQQPSASAGRTLSSRAGSRLRGQFLGDAAPVGTPRRGGATDADGGDVRTTPDLDGTPPSPALRMLLRGGSGTPHSLEAALLPSPSSSTAVPSPRGVLSPAGVPAASGGGEAAGAPGTLPAPLALAAPALRLCRDRSARGALARTPRGRKRGQQVFVRNGGGSFHTPREPAESMAEPGGRADG